MEVYKIFLISVSTIILIFVPGFMLSMAIFPRKDELDNIERIGISFVLGLMPQFLLYFADKNLFIPINTLTSYISIVLVSLMGLVIWFYRVNR
ncbi:MAG: hypothetical protein DRO92_04295 [Candidatus Altiarchaeales archaeon]|nr:MAG: hypothetical protein DRO92_04295 [Candidatus Altiarchaeales archaeon]